jgi:hypothetical protein
VTDPAALAVAVALRLACYASALIVLGVLVLYPALGLALAAAWSLAVWCVRPWLR